MILKYWLLCDSAHINTHYAAVIQLNNAIYEHWNDWRFCLLKAVFRLDKRFICNVLDILETGFYQVVYDALTRPSDNAFVCPTAHNQINFII